MVAGALVAGCNATAATGCTSACLSPSSTTACVAPVCLANSGCCTAAGAADNFCFFTAALEAELSAAGRRVNQPAFCLTGCALGCTALFSSSIWITSIRTDESVQFGRGDKVTSLLHTTCRACTHLHRFARYSAVVYVAGMVVGPAGQGAIQQVCVGNLNRVCRFEPRTLTQPGAPDADCRLSTVYTLSGRTCHAVRL